MPPPGELTAQRGPARRLGGGFQVVGRRFGLRSGSDHGAWPGVGDADDAARCRVPGRSGMH
jgi:hypothetical protein